MELKVEEIKALAPIQFNYEDIKKWVTEKAKEYKSVVYTEETITAAKTDRATLNKVAKAINDEKIRIKKEVLKPFEDFENKCKELQGIITDASNSIDSQVKEFELKEQAEKEKQIKAIFDENIGEYNELINFDTIFNPRWLNKTYSIKKIEEDIKHVVSKTTDDLNIIANTLEDQSLLQQITVYYFKNINDPAVLGNSLQEYQRIVESNKKLESLKNAQNVTKIEPKTTEITPNIQKPEGLLQIDFRVIATKEQFMSLKQFLETNNIDYRRI